MGVAALLVAALAIFFPFSTKHSTSTSRNKALDAEWPRLKLTDAELEPLLRPPAASGLYSGESAARLLSGEMPLPSGARALFEPGTLPLDRLDVLRRCWLNMSEVDGVKNSKGMIRSAPKYNFTFFLEPKVASSSGRRIMELAFGTRGQTDYIHIARPRDFRDRDGA